MDDFHAFKSTSGGADDGSGGGSGGGGKWDFGCGWVVIVVVAYMLIHFIFSGASADAIDTLLALGFLAFLFAKNLFR